MFHFNTALEGDSAANDIGRCGSEAHEHSAASEGREERGRRRGGGGGGGGTWGKSKHCLAEVLGDNIG